MVFYIFLLNSLLLLLTLINFVTIRRPHLPKKFNQSVLVLLPVRNEESNIERILNELENQIGVSNYKVLVINDNSEDHTRELVLNSLSEKISLFDAPLPQSGWIGKVSALESGLKSTASADVVISIDADVHFEKDAIAKVVTTLIDSKLDFISPYPHQIAISWAERLTQPLLQWSWMSTLLLRGAEKIPLISTVVCNGQFLVMKGESLRAIGGFQSVSHQVLDDIELGRSFVRSGFRGTVIDGSSIASTRMYSNFAEIRSGYGKSLNKAFGSKIGSFFAALFIFITGIIPVFYTFSGNLLSIAALIAIIGSRLATSAASSGRLRDSFLHPASSLLFIYLLYYSWINRGKTQWKGRTI
jgi:cellulose synthase/poly-beta-1,6-N-acetylglucosamine synthase-like glycosyltransferase